MTDYAAPPARASGAGARAGEYPLGAGRPPLAVDDLPTPEAVFEVPKTGLKETVTKIMGPALIALGLSTGSGEWLLGPQAIGQLGWVGVGFVIMVSIILQAFYDVEVGRYVMATGEVPSLGFGRIPPGFYVGTILAVGVFYIAFITGGWAAAAGASAFTALTGDIPATATSTRRAGSRSASWPRLHHHALPAEDLAEPSSSSSGSSSASSSSRSSSPYW
jgi:hypothetical protein